MVQYSNRAKICQKSEKDGTILKQGQNLSNVRKDGTILKQSQNLITVGKRQYNTQTEQDLSKSEKDGRILKQRLKQNLSPVRKRW